MSQYLKTKSAAIGTVQKVCPHIHFLKTFLQGYSFPQNRVRFFISILHIELVDGSNESLYHPDEESDPYLQKGIPLQKNLKVIEALDEGVLAAALKSTGYFFAISISQKVRCPV